MAQTFLDTSIAQALAKSVPTQPPEFLLYDIKSDPHTSLIIFYDFYDEEKKRY